MNFMSFMTPESIKKAKELEKKSTHSFNDSKTSTQEIAKKVLQYHQELLEDISKSNISEVNIDADDVKIIRLTLIGSKKT
ncbi:hypothetical protein [uncultured Acinetobacter sp.]|uniref:hypothetical protein n=1 Tax=uncultured Acinetobacter sp. TaxID=165433 RepID=UPI003747C493